MNAGEVWQNGWRARAAALVMMAVIAGPVLMTVGLGTVAINGWMTWIMLAFVAVMLPEAAQELTLLGRHRGVRIAGVVALLSMAAWAFYQGPFLNIPRFWFYVVSVPFFAAACGWFRGAGRSAFSLLYHMKLLVTVLALAAIAVAMASADEQRAVFRSLPVYRHIRHLNYDLTVVIALGMLFWTRAAPNAKRAYAVLFVALGYFSVWSGGRGQFMALSVFVALLVVSGSLSTRDAALWRPVMALLIGGLCVVISGQTEMLASQIGRSFLTPPDVMFSSRIHIWSGTLTRWQESPASILFGFAPDAFSRLSLPSVLWPPPKGFYIVHPHNAIVQWLLEFGLIGTLVLIVCCASLSLRARHLLRQRQIFGEAKAAAALLIALFCYSMTDGIFYHAAPFTMVLLLAAYVHVQAGRTEESTARLG